MTPRQEITRGLGVGVALALIAIVSSKCSESKWKARTDAALDSAKVARTEATVNAALARSAESRMNVALREKRAAEDSARRAIGDANRLRAQRQRVQAVASQPDAAPTVSDSLVAADSSLILCEQETLALRGAIQYDRDALAASERAQAEQAGALALERASVATLTRNLERVETQLASADPPCRVLFWSCPSRTTVAVGSAALATLFTLKLTR